MSRTYKDKSWKFKYPESQYNFGSERIPYEHECKVYAYIDNEWAWTGKTEVRTRYFYLDVAGAKTKKKKRVDSEWHWMTTPGWFIKEFMNRPQRAKGRMWEKKITKVALEDLDLLDTPSVGRKPHVYYW